jgi:hypothetical protein
MITPDLMGTFLVAIPPVISPLDQPHHVREDSALFTVASSDLRPSCSVEHTDTKPGRWVPGQSAYRPSSSGSAPDHAGAMIEFWADATVVHLMVNGVRLKTVPAIRRRRPRPDRPPRNDLGPLDDRTGIPTSWAAVRPATEPSSLGGIDFV